MMTPIETVRAFIVRFSEGKDGMIAAVREWFTPETVWENVGLATTTGIDEAIDLVRMFETTMDVHAIEIEMLAIAADGANVLTERIDRMFRADGSELGAPAVMGIFEIEDGKIRGWRDYFDSAAAKEMMSG